MHRIDVFSIVETGVPLGEIGLGREARFERHLRPKRWFQCHVGENRQFQAQNLLL
jgi:hypothetical protein